MKFPLTKKDLERIPSMYDQHLWSGSAILSIKTDNITIFLLMSECSMEEEQDQITITAKKSKTVEPIRISFNKEKQHITVETF